jgi:hypothetical protein
MKRVPAAAGVLVLGALTLWAFTAPPIEGVPAGTRVPSNAAYDPVAAGETLPEGFRQLLPRDAIAPVYEPQFVRAEQAAWPDDAQIIGVSSGDEAKAYPVSHLNQREMVIDEIEGIPILVSW